VRVVLLGPPGVGKGTQGRRLAQRCRWALISTGEMLREAVARGTTLGLEAKKTMEAGMLVSDQIMIELVKERSAAADAQPGFVLDGFPRTVTQANALDSMLQSREQRLDVVAGLEASRDELARRLSARRECPVCKRAYNLVSAPPHDGKHCDDHPEEMLVQREDDTEETVRRRLEVYDRQTAPLLSYYQGQGRLREVSAEGSMEDVYQSLTQALGCRV
jgi:adenylate kinase